MHFTIDKVRALDMALVTAVRSANRRMRKSRAIIDSVTEVAGGWRIGLILVREDGPSGMCAYEARRIMLDALLMLGGEVAAMDGLTVERDPGWDGADDLFGDGHSERYYSVPVALD